MTLRLITWFICYEHGTEEERDWTENGPRLKNRRPYVCGYLCCRCLSSKKCQLAVCCNNPLLFLARSSTIRKDLGTSPFYFSSSVFSSTRAKVWKLSSEGKKKEEKKQTWHLKEEPDWLHRRRRQDGGCHADSCTFSLASSHFNMSMFFKSHLCFFTRAHFLFFSPCPFTTNQSSHSLSLTLFLSLCIQPSSPFYLPASPSRPPGHMSSHCPLSIKSDYSVGFPWWTHYTPCWPNPKININLLSCQV